MINTFNHTETGEYHVFKGTDGQDASKTLKFTHPPTGKELTVSAISDGVGSTFHGGEGAKLAVNTAVDYLHQHLNELDILDDTTIIPLLKNTYNLAYDKIDALSLEQELSLVEYDCTLTVAVYDGETVYFGHIGDDGIVVVYEDGEFEMITTRHKGEEAHSLYPLRFTDLWQFSKTSKPVASFVMCTDGILDYFVHPTLGLIFTPFMERLLYTPYNSEESFEAEKQFWKHSMSLPSTDENSLRHDIKDDMTLLIVTNSERVEHLPPFTFNEDEYYATIQKYIEDRDRKLYGKYYAEKKQKEKSSKPANILADDPATATDDQLSIGIGTSNASSCPCNPKTGLPNVNEMHDNLQNDTDDLSEASNALQQKTTKGVHPL